MTNQEAFDFVVRSLVVQGKPSVEGTSCSYRAPDGCRCAAGWLIPDDKYNPRMEGVTVSSVVVKAALPPKLSLYLIADLQRAHDGAFEVSFSKNDNQCWLETFLMHAREVAEEHKLSTEIVDISEQALCEVNDAWEAAQATMPSETYILTPPIE